MATESHRSAAAPSGDNEDAIGIASPYDQLPVSYDLQDWDRSHCLNLTGMNLNNLADYRADVNYAELARVSSAKAALCAHV